MNNRKVESLQQEVKSKNHQRILDRGVPKHWIKKYFRLLKGNTLMQHDQW